MFNNNIRCKQKRSEKFKFESSKLELPIERPMNSGDAPCRTFHKQVAKQFPKNEFPPV